MRKEDGDENIDGNDEIAMVMVIVMMVMAMMVMMMVMMVMVMAEISGTI